MIIGLSNKVKYVAQILFPKLWSKRYSNSSIEGTTVGNVYIEWWGYKTNLGDWLTNPVVEYMLNRNHQMSVVSKSHPRNHLFVIGSIIGFNAFNATIWGTGVLNLTQAANIVKQSVFREYDIRAVRGPLTKRVMESAGYHVPNVFGDPAILIPLMYSPKIIDKKYEYSVIFHFRYSRTTDDYHTIDIQTQNYEDFVDEIVSSKLIISSSLHGIIIAESYGVPAILLCENLAQEDLFKYYDYYYSTGRFNVIIANSIEQALQMQPMPLPDNLKELREGLINSFPYDLWD